MKKSKREALEKSGWKVGTVAEFLGLTEEESALLELKLALSRSLRERRTKQGLTQTQLARQLRSSQSRVAKMEAANPSVSIDLLVRSLFALGASPKDLGRVLARSHGSEAETSLGTVARSRRAAQGPA
jgi:transcriptional regulator with XRE-family HTH domain